MIDVEQAKLIDECRRRERERRFGGWKERLVLKGTASVHTMTYLRELCGRKMNECDLWASLGFAFDVQSPELSFQEYEFGFSQNYFFYSLSIHFRQIVFKRVYSCCPHLAINRNSVGSVLLPKRSNISGNLISGLIRELDVKKECAEKKLVVSYNVEQKVRLALRCANVVWALMSNFISFFTSTIYRISQNRFVKCPEKYSETRLDLIVHRLTQFSLCI